MIAQLQRAQWCAKFKLNPFAVNFACFETRFSPSFRRLQMKSSRMSSCMLLWIVLLYCFGADCAFKTIVMAQNVPVINSCPSPPQNTTSGWTYIGTKSGIETYLKKVEGSDLLATRGVAYLDMHISQAMGPYINLTLARDWVHMLKHIKQYPIENDTDLDPDADEDMIYQVTLNGDQSLSFHFYLAT